MSLDRTDLTVRIGALERRNAELERRQARQAQAASEEATRRADADEAHRRLIESNYRNGNTGFYAGGVWYPDDNRYPGRT